MARQDINVYKNLKDVPDSVKEALLRLRQDFESHIHDGSSGRAFQSLVAEAISTRSFSIRKTAFSDTAAGVWMGLVDGTMKLKLGSASSYLQWDGNTLSIVGSVTATTGTIGGWAIGATTLTGGSVTLDSGGTITAGGILRTAASGTRIVLENNVIKIYDSAALAGTIEGLSGFVITSGQWSIDELQIITSLLVSGTIVPDSAGTIDLGSATNYWNDVNYKTLTDRGCLGWFDEGVELQDGRMVSDIEALLEIKKHPTKKTVYGKPMLDYTTLPKAVYKPADKQGKLIARNEANEPIEGQDGAETTALISIMLGAIKELSTQVKELQKMVKM